MWDETDQTSFACELPQGDWLQTRQLLIVMEWSLATWVSHRTNGNDDLCLQRNSDSTHLQRTKATGPVVEQIQWRCWFLWVLVPATITDTNVALYELHTEHRGWTTQWHSNLGWTAHGRVGLLGCVDSLSCRWNYLLHTVIAWAEWLKTWWWLVINRDHWRRKSWGSELHIRV